MRSSFGSITWVCGGLFICLGGLGQEAPQIRFARIADLDSPGGGHQAKMTRTTGNQPIEFQRENYGDERPTLLGLMPRTLAVGGVNGNGNQSLYIPLAGHGGLLVLHTPVGKFDVQSGGRRIGVEALAGVFGDYDHSGHESLFIGGRDGIAAYQNRGHHRFSDTTHKTGLRLAKGLVCTSIAMGDFDGDGFPDLVAAVYTNLDQPPSKPTITFPNDLAGASSRLFRNNRDGTFTDVTESAGFGGNPGRARKVIIADFNNDTRPDILLLRDDKPPVLYLNRGAWRFDDETWDAGDALTTHAFFEGAAADFNRDGKPDLVLWSTHSCRLLINQGNAVFRRLDTTSIPEPEISVFGFRGLAADLNGDGFVDLMTVDQHGRLRLFANAAGNFREVSFALPPGTRDGFLSWFPSNDHKSIYVLSRQSDGHLALLQSEVPKDERARRPEVRPNMVAKPLMRHGTQRGFGRTGDP